MNVFFIPWMLSCIGTEVMGKRDSFSTSLYCLLMQVRALWKFCTALAKREWVHFWLFLRFLANKKVLYHFRKKDSLWRWTFLYEVVCWHSSMSSIRSFFNMEVVYICLKMPA